jgi:hypothetical protein
VDTLAVALSIAVGIAIGVVITVFFIKPSSTPITFSDYIPTSQGVFYKNKEEWIVERDEEGRMKGLIVNREARRF